MMQVMRRMSGAVRSRRSSRDRQPQVDGAVRTAVMHATPPDCDPATAAIVDRVRPWTLTPPSRVMALCDTVRHLQRAGVEGPIVECGVWRGGSMAAAALALLETGRPDRDLYLFDTFTGMPDPSERDVHCSGRSMLDLWDSPEELRSLEERFHNTPLEEVRAVVESTGYPSELVHLIPGLVEDTIPEHAPEQIAVLRLDTDWYESTLHELEHLYPRVVPGGVVIIDDYGEFLGAREAVDEYLARLGHPVLLHRVDDACRLIHVT